ncbi:hypothetical protein D3C84_1087470 [compost metagenome]
MTGNHLSNTNLNSRRETVVVSVPEIVGGLLIVLGPNSLHPFFENFIPSPAFGVSICSVEEDLIIQRKSVLPRSA